MMAVDGDTQWHTNRLTSHHEYGIIGVSVERRPTMWIQFSGQMRMTPDMLRKGGIVADTTTDEQCYQLLREVDIRFLLRYALESTMPEVIVEVDRRS
jgi:hypothetical protein